MERKRQSILLKKDSISCSGDRIVATTFQIVEPGAVKTNFGRRETDFHFDESLRDYKEYNNLVRSAFGKMGGNTVMAAPEAVAEAIYQITLEESQQLRYIVGEDAKTMIGMREKYGDEAFIQSIRARFS